MKKQLSSGQMLANLQALCAASEQCTSDIYRKLTANGFSIPQTEEIIDSLLNDRFIDDARYARAFVRDKYRFNRWGRQKIISQLIAKKIPRPFISDALSEIDELVYRQNLLDILRSKNRQIKTDVDSYTRRNKLIRFAASRGFEINTIITLLEDIGS